MPEVVVRLRVENEGQNEIAKFAESLFAADGAITKIAGNLKGQAIDGMKSLAAESGAAGQALSALGPYGIAAAAALTVVTGAASAVASTLLESAEAAIEHAGRMADLAAATGTTAEAQQEFAYAASLVGGSVETANAALFKMEAALGKSPEKFELLGLSAAELSRQSPDEMLRQIAEAANGISDPLQRAAVMQELLGKGAQAAMPFLLSNLDAARERAHSLGLVMSEDTVAGLDKLGDEIDTLSQTWEGLWRNIGAALANNPKLIEAIQNLTQALGDLSKWVQDNGDTILKVGDFLTLGLVSGKIEQINAQAAAVKEKDFLSYNTRVSAPAAKAAAADAGLPLDIEHVPIDPKVLEQAKHHLAEIKKEEAEAARAREKAAKEHETAVKATAKATEELKLQTENYNDQLESSAVYAQALADGLGKSYAEFAAKQAEVDQKRDADLGKLKLKYDQDIAAAEKGKASTTELTRAYEEQQTAIRAAAEDTKRANEDAFRPLQQSTIELKRETSDLTNRLKEQAAEFAAMADAARDAGSMFSQLGGIAGQLGLGGGAGILGGAGGFFDALGGFKDFQAQKAADAAEGIATPFIKSLNAALPMAAAGIGLVTTVVKLFGGKSEAEKIAEELGGNITDGLAKAIEATEKKDKVSRALAVMLNAADVFKETGATKPIEDLMNAVALGAVDATEGISELSDAFDQLQASAEGGNVASEAAMVQMIKRSRELGESIPAITAFVNTTLADAADVLQDFYAGQGIATKRGGALATGAASDAQAAANQEIFGAVFDAMTAQRGLLEATTTLSDDLDALTANLDIANNPDRALTGSAAQAAYLRTLLEDPMFKGATSSATAGARVMEDLSKTANLSQKTVDAFGVSTKSLFDQALGGAKGDQNAALQAVLPMLTQLQHAQAQGAKLTPDSAALLAKAQEAGLLPMQTIQEQQLDVLKQIRDGSKGERAAGVPASLSGSTVTQIGAEMGRAVRAGSGVPMELSSQTVAQIGEAMRLALMNSD